MNEHTPSLRPALPMHLWSRAVAAETGINAASCYQCLRCTNSCPVSAFMDIKPHQVVRFVQLGQREKLLECSSVWVCLSCEMCSTYCPNEIDVAGLMNFVKNSVIASHKRPAEVEIALFHEIFLEVLHKYGRMNDLQLMQRFKLKTLFTGCRPSYAEVKKDMELARELFQRGRLKLAPERSRAAREIRSILERRHGRVISS
ncbi:4Fe-4S dicluster domain-containing protein [Desulfoferrobacter suflitae]|uniref:4Fe-4S dicluster domain-containing protein n=1 Tax=Desulfoferrobacter suflitae TaxID=2865782 RepID=UPI002164D7F1|nr:4Fe-4S dicluster domain-containing protein [Desulfoferrobacter suflitae]MCK8601817.1 4Fe-4S dicluster domain-containing protein [Desulfoferrobacter suflitae]